MSVFKLNKYLEEPFEPPISSTHTILLSDSKGSYIQSNFHSLHPSFEFVHRGGARLGDQLCWVKQNLNSRVLSHGRLTLYIWLGTCDLTYKISRSRSIALRHSSDDECLRYFQHIIQEFQSELVCFSTVKVVWLDIPPYSISMWNIIVGNHGTFSISISYSTRGKIDCQLLVLKQER